MFLVKQPNLANKVVLFFCMVISKSDPTTHPVRHAYIYCVLEMATSYTYNYLHNFFYFVCVCLVGWLVVVVFP